MDSIIKNNKIEVKRIGKEYIVFNGWMSYRFTSLDDLKLRFKHLI